MSNATIRARRRRRLRKQMAKTPWEFGRRAVNFMPKALRAFLLRNPQARVVHEWGDYSWRVLIGGAQ